VRESLGACKLSVHLIGETYGVIPDGEAERSIVRLQHDVAMELSGQGQLARVLWLPEALVPKEPRQPLFVEELRTSPAVQAGAELLQTPLEELKAFVLRKLRKNGKPEVPGSDCGRRKIYLILDAGDADDAASLNQHLNARGYEVLLPVLDTADTRDAEAVDVHCSNMLDCDAVLIYYGAGRQAWFEYYYRELKKTPALGRSKPLPPMLVYAAGPETAHKKLLRAPDCMMLRNFGDFDPDELGQFLRAADGQKGGV
jgi:hypothetical protein